MITFFAAFSLSIVFASASVAHIEHYEYRGPPAPLSNDGRVIDTPEVAHAKTAHLAAYAAAAAGVPGKPAPYQGTSSENGEGSTFASGSSEYVSPVYTGPPAPLAEDGRVIDTIEVARAKAAHLAAHAAALAAAPQEPANESETATWDDTNVHPWFFNPAHVAYTIHHANRLYRGPSAPLAPDGRVVDTAEVAETKAKHLRAYAKAVSDALEKLHQNCQC